MEIHAVRVRALKRAVAKFPTISAFAKHYAIDCTYISQLLHGHRNMGEKAARNIESKLKLPFGTLDYEPDVGEEAALEAESHRAASSEPEGRRHFAHESVPKIPLISFVQAGVWREAVNSHRDGGAEDYLHSQVPQGKDAFALTVRGASMQPEFREGDVIIVDPDIRPTPGDYVVALNAEEEATFKKYRPRGRDESGQDVVELVPLNDDFPTLRSDLTPFSIIGTVTEHRRYRRRH